MVKFNKNNSKQHIDYILKLLRNQNKESFRDYFLELHPTDQTVILLVLDVIKRKLIYEYLSPAELGEIFQGLEVRDQKRFFSELEPAYAVNMLNHMHSDDAADFLSELDEKVAQGYLVKMIREEALEVKELLGYSEETAGALMTTEYIVALATETVADIMHRLRQEGPEAETIYYIYIVDQDEKLVGVVSLRELIISQLEQPVEEIMITGVVSVLVYTDQEQVADVISRYDLLAVPVVDSLGKLVGIITVDDIIDVLEEEVTEDFGEISAVKGAVDLNIGSVEASKKRLPWLVLLLFVGMLPAGIIGSFEGTLEEVAILAIFIPLIADMAGNTGTQSLAVVVRGLALGKIDRPTIYRLIKRDAGIGIVMGVTCGILVTIISQIVTRGNIVLGFIVGFSLFCTLIVATLAGTIIPLIIHRFEIDPAVASGPFITTVNDIIGLLIYFSIATALIDYI